MSTTRLLRRIPAAAAVAGLALAGPGAAAAPAAEAGPAADAARTRWAAPAAEGSTSVPRTTGKPPAKSRGGDSPGRGGARGEGGATGTPAGEATTATRTPGPAPRPAAWATVPAADAPAVDYAAIEEAMAEVTEELEASGARIGVALLDRATGRVVANERGGESFMLASLVKVFIAEVVGYTNYTPPEGSGITAGSGEMPQSGYPDAMLRDDMIRLSDNEATTALWARYGGAEIMDSIRTRYGLSEATVNGPNWSSVQASPEDMVRFYDGVLSGTGGMSEAETDYFTRLLLSLPKYSYGGMDQDIGIRAALPDEEVGQKNGWVDPLMRTSAGFFGEDRRFTMAVLTSGVGRPEALTEAVAGILEDRLPGHGAPAKAAAVRPASSGGAPAGLLALGGLALAGGGFALGWGLRRNAAAWAAE